MTGRRSLPLMTSLMLAAISWACVSRAQTPQVPAVASVPRLSFDIASMRQNDSGLPPSGDEPDSNIPMGPGNVFSPTGGLLTGRNLPLMQYISFAYRMTSSQRDSFEEAAPAWVREQRYNLQARTENQAVTKDELRLMVRSLLADRFRMAVHYETRVASVFGMQLVKPGTPGPRLRPHPADGCSRAIPAAREDGSPPPPETTVDGFPGVCGGLLMLPDSKPGHFHIGARDVPISLIANALPGWGDLGRPVVDETGLTGNYDFSLEFIPKHGDPPPGAIPAAEAEEPNFIDSLRRQLGLKLDAQKQEVKVLILDHIEHLSDN